MLITVPTTRDRADLVGGVNWNHYSKPKVDALLARSGVKIDDKARGAALQQAGTFVAANITLRRRRPRGQSESCPVAVLISKSLGGDLHGLCCRIMVPGNVRQVWLVVAVQRLDVLVPGDPHQVERVGIQGASLDVASWRKL